MTDYYAIIAALEAESAKANAPHNLPAQEVPITPPFHPVSISPADQTTFQGANAAIAEYDAFLANTPAPTSSEIIQHYPKEAISTLTAIGGGVLIAYYAVIAITVYAVVGHKGYIYRFAISLIAFSLATVAALSFSGMNIGGLRVALSFGSTIGAIAAVVGIAFATFYRKAKD